MGLKLRRGTIHFSVLKLWKNTVLFPLLLPAFVAMGQFSIPDSILANPPLEFRYQFPISPGHPGLLAGTMGELRSTHFHAGIDIRTNNMIGTPVLTSQRGFVSRVWISSYGYGNALFVRHPNGQTTLYAHLDRYNGALAEFVRQYQYRQKTFDVDLFFEPNQFPVIAGDTLAFSGNTGGSSGPHLHFEIRDSTNEALNPLLFGFSEIKDTYAPVAQRVALKTLDKDSRINDRFGRFEFYLYKVGNTYTTATPLLAHGRIGVEILAYDKMDRSGFKCGINFIEMFADSQKVFQQVIDRINFNETRGILALMDFKALKANGTRFNKLYVDDASRLGYHQTRNNGVILIDNKNIPVSIVLRDSYGNSSEVKFEIRHSPVNENPLTLQALLKPIEFDWEENTLSISVRPCLNTTNSITLFAGKDKIEVKPSYQNSGRAVYLVDLRKSIYDSVTTCNGTFHFDYQDVVPSGTDYKYYSEWMDIKFRNGALYDTLYLTLSKMVKDSIEVFSIGNKSIPLHKSIDITLKPEFRYPADGKTGVYQIGNGNGYTYLGGDWRNDRVHFEIQEMGDFGILRDTTPPYLRRISLGINTARFRIHDNLSGISHFEASINGEWLLMNYDYKTGILQSERLDKAKPLKGDFKLTVTDHAGNETIFNQKIL